MKAKYLTIQRNPTNVYPEMHKALTEHIPPDVLEMIGLHGGYIAGGAVSSSYCGREIVEYDIFARSLNGANRIIGMLVENSRFEEECLTDNAHTFKYRTHVDAGCKSGELCLIRTIKLQVIFMPERIGEPENVIRSFDFVACMGAFDPATKEFIFAEGFLGNNIDHILIYNHEAIYPLNSLLRIPKYIKKGYSIDKYNMLLMAMRVNVLPLDTISDVAIAAAGKYDADEDIIKSMRHDIERILRGDYL